MCSRLFTGFVEIFSDKQRDGLRYIEAANSGGYQPTADQVIEWVLHREPRPRRRGPMIEPSKPSVFGQSVLDALTPKIEYPSVLKSLYARLPTDGFEAVLSAAGPPFTYSDLFRTPAKYGPDTPPESYVDHMIRLSWVMTNGDGGLLLTALGRALLRNDALTNETDGDATVIVLEAGNELAYPQLIGHIADSGDAYVIDPYAKADHVWRLMTSTGTTRVLTGPNLRPREVAELRQLLTVARSSFEVRQAGAGVLHDRFIIGDLGVHQVGASGNTIGKVTTTLFEHPPITADQLAELAEQWWEQATVIEPAVPRPSVEPGSDGPVS